MKNRAQPEASIFAGRMRREALLLFRALEGRGKIAKTGSAVLEKVAPRAEVKVLGKEEKYTLSEAEEKDMKAVVSGMPRWEAAMKELKVAMRQKFSGAEGQPGNVWDWGAAMGPDEVDEYAGLKRSILVGFQRLAWKHRACQVREMRFRVKAVEGKTRYVDSGVAMEPNGGGGWKKIGILKKVVRAQVMK